MLGVPAGAEEGDGLCGSLPGQALDLGLGFWCAHLLQVLLPEGLPL
jgi:hypothetical protein